MSEENKQITRCARAEKLLGMHVEQLRNAHRLAATKFFAECVAYKRQTWAAAINALQGTKLSEDEAVALVRQDMYAGFYHEVIGSKSAMLYHGNEILAFVGVSFAHDERIFKRQFFLPSNPPEGKAP